MIIKKFIDVMIKLSDKNIINRELIITTDEFSFIKEQLSKDDGVKLINDFIETNFELLDFPIEEPTNSDVMDDINGVIDFDFEKLINNTEWFSRYKYERLFNDIVINQSTKGLRISGKHTHEQRMKCDSINSPSPYRVWNNYKFRKSMLSALWSLKIDKVNNKTLKSCISMRKYVASQFRPTSAITIYNMFNAKNVLDLSSGWGDRLVGYHFSNAESYTGIDPNESLQIGYTNIIDMLDIKGANMNIGCAEDFEHKRTYDFIFTSPPYFNVERYTQDETQSFKKFRKLDEWLNGFLFKSLENAYNKLEDGGYMVINISDVYSNHRVNKICDPMCNFVVEKLGAEYLGCIGYRMSKRKNSKSDSNGVFAEPIWIFGKNVKTLPF